MLLDKAPTSQGPISGTSPSAVSGGSISTPNIPTKQGEVKEPAKKPDKIEDFGEVLHGARKHYSVELSDDLKTDINVAMLPLSKSWPLPDYKKLLDSGVNPRVVSMVRALRETLPSKPRKRGISGWAETVSKHRSLAAKVLSELENKDDTRLSFNLSVDEEVKDCV